MVRVLANVPGDVGGHDNELTEEHLEIAKAVLQHKFVVGLLERKGESFHRFEQFFDWKFDEPQETQCKDKLLHWSWTSQHSHPQVEEGSTVWDLLYKKNELDVRLYEFGKQLFVQQAVLFSPAVATQNQWRGMNTGSGSILLSENDGGEHL